MASPKRTKRPMTIRTILAVGLLVSTLWGSVSGETAASAAAAGPQKLSKKTMERADDQYQKGVIALRYGLTDEAIRYGHSALSLNPNHVDAHNLLGSAYYTKGDYAQSAASYEKAVELDPNVPDVHRNLGLAYLETKEEEKAEAAFRKAVEINGDPEASFQLSRLYYGKERYEEALEFILKTIQKNRNSAAAYNLKGVILNQLGRHKEALGSFQAGLVLAPEDIGLQINLGIALINVGEPAKARPVFEKVIPLIKEEALKARVVEFLKSLDK